jgi:hypothetical protein
MRPLKEEIELLDAENMVLRNQLKVYKECVQEHNNTIIELRRQLVEVRMELLIRTKDMEGSHDESTRGR